MTHRYKNIAIILSDTLQRIGLRCLLLDYFSPIEITAFPGFDDFCKVEEDSFDFYFTQPDIFICNADYFLPKRNKTILLLNDSSSALPPPGQGFHSLPLKASQEVILEQLQHLFASTINHTPNEGNRELSSREIDVLQLIVKGITNKEIADKLNISLNTVLTHRKNITSKLGIKTVPGLTFYAIMNGLISGDEIEL
ncbi:LuxR C-terminal-related transcriptional regulator [Parabacteroides sp. Marseille-P3160]|uniref:response regulator transcription factor n=1 Tax=Parabacteroides sp. Marseille-P3160 TaxID=1917887 RepID=UPI0009B9CC0C|nr:LuxR C-terminal-related transcriptional regulator [Parabacteroides sp. Marseille-P3160]